MAEAHKWHNESMAALYAMQNENGWADDDEDFLPALPENITSMYRNSLSEAEPRVVIVVLPCCFC